MLRWHPRTLTEISAMYKSLMDSPLYYYFVMAILLNSALVGISVTQASRGGFFGWRGILC